MSRQSPLTAVGVVSGIIVFAVAFSLIAGYNSLVRLDQGIQGAYSEIENRLQERNDKIGQLVSTVSGLQEFEASIYAAITGARAAYAAANSIDELIAADALTAVSISDLIVVVEDNPNLTTSGAYYSLMDEISSMESTLSIARRDYNDSVQDYNTSIKTFPMILFASMFNYDTEAEYYKMNDGADELPIIDFDGE